MTILFSIIIGIVGGLSWCTTSPIIRCILGFIALLGWISILQRSNRPVLNSFIIALLTNGIGAVWLYGTIRVFGGFPVIASVAIYALYVITASVPHTLIPILAKPLRRYIGTSLSLATAWVAAEYFPLRLFPWSVGHLSGETPLALMASLSGVPLITLALVVIVAYINERRFVASLVVMTCCWALTLLAKSTLSLQSDNKITVAGVQGNISLQKKHNIELIEQNVDTYSQLSREVFKNTPSTDLIVWPESVLVGGVPLALTDRTQLSKVYNIPEKGNLLIGAITFASRDEVYNSAIGLNDGGEMTAPYHKQILMPFGEYTPFGDIFPWLRHINETAGEFNQGLNNAPISFDNGIKAGALICYEDIVPELALRSVEQGANLLVTISNDAWFGDTAEPYQHNLLASFRAIETGRYLVRVSNTGLTSIISPHGILLSSIAPYTEGVVTGEVFLLNSGTWYTKIGDSPWRILSAIIYLVTIITGLRNLCSTKRS